MEHVPALIVGAGPIGLACAISARRRGVHPVVIDSGAIADAIVRYPIGMSFFTTPERLEIGDHPLTCAGAKPTREEALKYYRGVARVERLTIRPYHRLIAASREADLIRCVIVTRGRASGITCDRLVIATGYFDHPNRLGVPGEDLAHVRHWFDEAHRCAGLNVVIVGGKNSAVETALQCFRAGARVTLVHRGTSWKPTLKYWLRPDLENRIAAGEIHARLGYTVREITNDTVLIEGPDGTERLPADRVYPLIGYHPDFELLRSIGIELDPDTQRARLDPATLESNVPGIHVAGSAGAGRMISEVFIENGRLDGEKIFGGDASRVAADNAYRERIRPAGE